MLPEIAMTAALIDRFTARFGARPIEWHSSLGDRQRRLHWQAIARGEAKFILGARSALFLPYPALGLIVVDEEHEAAYKQEEGVIYHGRDMAVARAHLGNIPVVLSSATPSWENTATSFCLTVSAMPQCRASNLSICANKNFRRRNLSVPLCSMA
jgi:primosomal protein N' (replication factor Y)